MIKGEHIDKCCGCSACAQACPAKCITMQEDKDGFIYPKILEDNCIECNLCSSVCPALIPVRFSKNITKAYAAYNLDENERLNSSSGGIFTLLAKQILKENGIVYGAAMSENCKSVIHIRVCHINELDKLRGSKYVQSVIGDNYIKIKEDLINNKKVLFSGTPCQIYGLRTFLKKDYPNLFCVDVCCHGVPSPKLWRKYIDFQEKRTHANVHRTFFRNKFYGWKMFALLLEFSNNKAYKQILYKDLFMQMFLQDLCLRPSCYNCQFKGVEGVSDISLADFWGAENVCPKLDDDKGLSLVLVHTYKGKDYFREIMSYIKSEEIELSEAISSNLAIIKSCSKPECRDNFMNDIDSLSLYDLKNKYLKKRSIATNLRIWLSINVKKRFLKS